MDKIKEKIESLNKEGNRVDLWEEDNKKKAGSILKEKNYYTDLYSKYTQFYDEISYYNELIELSKQDEQLDIDINKELKILKINIEDFEIESMFTESDDKNDCFLEINTGVGGTDACDFSNMLLNMYLKWCKNNNFSVNIINLQDGDEAGITNAVLQISGINAFGWLKNESGVHRLVRISPYNANGKRQTSFSSVWVYPVVNNEIKIEINENDLKIDTYKSSGAGGQHINKTDSAVRITHLPTKIVVQCQTQRSQHQNKEEAMRLLKSRLYELDRQKQQEEKDKLNNKKTNNGWGYQVRNYVLHPYQLVKDLRSNYEVNNFEKMLNGDYLTDFMKSLIKL
ncbi:MAG: peptide chain release factor 2 [Rickettsiales bacterium]|nr:peptide chain release factor 2 [Rickettsiales bacterium]